MPPLARQASRLPRIRCRILGFLRGPLCGDRGLAYLFSSVARRLGRCSCQLGMGSGLLGRSPQFFELLPYLLRDGAKALGILTINLTRNALQLGRNALLLRGLAFVVGVDTGNLSFRAAVLGALTLDLVVLGGFFDH